MARNKKEAKSEAKIMWSPGDEPTLGLDPYDFMGGRLVEVIALRDTNGISIDMAVCTVAELNDPGDRPAFWEYSVLVAYEQNARSLAMALLVEKTVEFADIAGDMENWGAEGPKFTEESAALAYARRLAGDRVVFGRLKFAEPAAPEPEYLADPAQASTPVADGYDESDGDFWARMSRKMNPLPSMDPSTGPSITFSAAFSMPGRLADEKLFYKESEGQAGADGKYKFWGVRLNALLASGPTPAEYHELLIRHGQVGSTNHREQKVGSYPLQTDAINAKHDLIRKKVKKGYTEFEPQGS